MCFGEQHWMQPFVTPRGPFKDYNFTCKGVVNCHDFMERGVPAAAGSDWPASRRQPQIHRVCRCCRGWIWVWRMNNEWFSGSVLYSILNQEIRKCFFCATRVKALYFIMCWRFFVPAYKTNSTDTWWPNWSWTVRTAMLRTSSTGFNQRALW